MRTRTFLGIGDLASEDRCEFLRGHAEPCEDARALDVGVGSGYLAAAMAQMCGLSGRVIGIDNVPELVKMAKANLANSPKLCHLLEGDPPRVMLVQGDGWRGVPGSQFAAIHVGAAAASVPKALVEQLEPGGRMIIPIGPPERMQVLVAVDKRLDGEIVQTELMSVRYVPLVKG